MTISYMIRHIPDGMLQQV